MRKDGAVAHWKFEGILQDDGWLSPAYVTTDAGGDLVEISGAPDGAPDEEVRGWAMPGLVNAHSHAFQYAMAGLAEHLPPHASSDDFWSWREGMYDLALRISPDGMEAVAAMLYAEMLRFGYTAVVEFHYLHHDPKGAPYANRAEMGERLLAAAARAGIDITLIPVYYNRGGFGTAPEGRQRRFLSSSVAAYGRLLEATQDAARGHAHARIGIGVHSLRAAAPRDVVEIFTQAPPATPRHIHAAEQAGEVGGCLAHLHARPVEWLLGHLPVDERYTLVHATHANDAEAAGIAAAGAGVALCPSTEGNLGDGFFPLRKFRAHGGRWCIGTDSHVCLNPFEDLRLLDYGQRLLHERRNVLCSRPGQDSGAVALTESLRNGRRAAGAPSGPLFPLHRPFDAVVLDADAPLIRTRTPERLPSTFVYASDPTAILGTIKGGRWMVRRQRHVGYDEIVRDFVRAMEEMT